MTIIRLLGLLLVYFIGYIWLTPLLATKVTLWLDPNALFLRSDVLIFFYLLWMILVLWLSWTEWKKSLKKVKEEPLSYLFRMVFGGLAVIVLNVILSMISSFLSGQSDSVNQSVIIENVSIAPLFMLFSVLIFAPIVEESVFRGGIFAFCRRFCPFWCAALISALAFGGIHVMDSLLNGQWSDGIYLLVYGSIGWVNAWYYERQGGICTSCGVHFFNNLLSYVLMII